ncbi:MAG: hypothetical protein J6L76_00515 [Clostridia bacterium]|nr:hypothetical protein [Clostridia bacterium]
MKTQVGTIQFSLTWQGFLNGVLMVGGIIAIVFFIVLLFRLIRLVGKVDLWMDRNQASIETTIGKMPVIAQSVEDAVTDVCDITGGVSHVFHIFRKFSGK